MFHKESIKENSGDTFKQRDYPIYFQKIDSGFEICLYVFLAISFSSNIEGNTKVDTERLKTEIKEIKNR